MSLHSKASIANTHAKWHNWEQDTISKWIDQMIDMVENKNCKYSLVK